MKDRVPDWRDQTRRVFELMMKGAEVKHMQHGIGKIISVQGNGWCEVSFLKRYESERHLVVAEEVQEWESTPA